MKDVFERYELKFVISKEQRNKLRELLDIYMKEDQYGKSSLYNLYYDTEDFLLIRRSIEKPVYKEKLRLRSYKEVDDSSEVFVEIKKKMKKIVYKRRVVMRYADALMYLKDATGVQTDNNIVTKQAQILREIDYFKEMYQTLAPRVLIAYDREAYFGEIDESFRLTFDQNIIWSDTELNLKRPSMGALVLEEDKVLMEIKVSSGIPMWLTKFLSENNIYKTSFSKYGNAYKQILQKQRDKDNVA